MPSPVIEFEHTPRSARHGEAVVVTVPGHTPRVWDPHLAPIDGDPHRAHIATHLAVEGLPIDPDSEEWRSVDSALRHDYVGRGGAVNSGGHRQSWRAADYCTVTVYREAKWRRDAHPV